MFPLVAGVYRAARGDVVLIDGVSMEPEQFKRGNPPHEYFYRGGGLDTRRWRAVHSGSPLLLDPQRFSVASAPIETFYTGDVALISTPLEAPHLTLVETDHVHASPNYLTVALSRMDLGLTVFQFRSEMDVKTRNRHFFFAFRRGEFIRDVESNCRMKKAGWRSATLRGRCKLPPQAPQ